jgi:O-antigen ligase
VGIALLIVTVIGLGKKLKYMLVSVLIFGGVMSMQKAAVVNLVLYLIACLFFLGRRNIFLSIFLLTIPIVLMSVVAYLYQESLVSLYYQEFIFNSLGVNLFNNDQLVKSTVLDRENMVERLMGIHLDEIFGSHHPVVLVLVGIGVSGAGGGMGLPEFPQAHNTYWDLLFMGGIGYLGIFLALFFLVNKRLTSRGDRLSRLLFVSNLMFAINSFSSSASIYQPVLSMLFWFSVIATSYDTNLKTA